ncbi:ATP-binding cassette domain-containing protein [Maribacter sp. HTCC2170]|uniref:ATP-binding cassette domain-containing protein n=1 Tax=Maribacter sp. (strain HTCC2170 / KCCM 42371) TaxID=313603 RepID=UPI00006B6E8F|nr:ATP-binding cassette domain-containing protein [Maribacter sp. HTCC2170]EAQ99648.1 putative anion transport protein (ABC superfamily, ATP-binding protein) [Maribacter sp. HTCC2170]
MLAKAHWAIFIDNSSEKIAFIDNLFNGNIPEALISIKGLKGALFSKLALLKLIVKESRHGDSGITGNSKQSLQTMSSGEQKRVLLNYLLNTKPDFLVLDNPFDNLDQDFQVEFQTTLKSLSKNIIIIQIISRKNDLLPFVSNYAQLRESEFLKLPKLDNLNPNVNLEYFNGSIPPPLKWSEYKDTILIELNKVNVSYAEKPILKNISWQINKGDFWELSGKNGSGKTTLLSMITGENPKGYGQDLYLFGFKKGSGESVWDIKKNIGYFTPSMTDKFTGYHSVEHMIISGILDSVGLYVRPTEAQTRLAKEWLKLINLWEMKDTLFHDLTMGQKRLVMTTRAMIKHPLLLILDEPTAGLDDESAMLLVNLVNKIALESSSAIIFVSHRKEPGLSPTNQLILKTSDMGSIGQTS